MGTPIALNEATWNGIDFVFWRNEVSSTLKGAFDGGFLIWGEFLGGIRDRWHLSRGE